MKFGEHCKIELQELPAMTSMHCTILGSCRRKMRIVVIYLFILLHLQIGDPFSYLLSGKRTPSEKLTLDPFMKKKSVKM